MKKDTSKIPKGCYCHESGNRSKVCPYWSIDPTKPEQENGYCSFLEKGDWEINEEIGDVEWTNSKTGDKTITKAHDIPMGLLWDQCKECGENDYTDKEFEEMIDE